MKLKKKLFSNATWKEALEIFDRPDKQKQRKMSSREHIVGMQSLTVGELISKLQEANLDPNTKIVIELQDEFFIGDDRFPLIGIMNGSGGGFFTPATVVGEHAGFFAIWTT